jgi:hypothetical protein
MQMDISLYKVEIQDIFTAGEDAYIQKYPVCKQQRKAIFSIIHCRKPLMGKHIDKCDHCGHYEISYNSCRNRHCPKCQASKQNVWIEQLEASLPPVRYFHIVFTVPCELNETIYKHQKLCYDLMFKTSAQTMLQVASRPGFLGAQSGCLSVLHTWGQNLQYHPHIHMLVPAGGLSEDAIEWVNTGKKFFVPVKILSIVFRGKFIQQLEKLYINRKIDIPGNFSSLKAQLYKKNWVVYSKKTFAGPGQVINYLGKYTHRIAISNNRIIAHKQDKVDFFWKDYRDHKQWKIMQLDTLEFMRRYLLHVLPVNFYKIRYYGIFSLAGRKQKLIHCIKLIHSTFNDWNKILTYKKQHANIFLRICPVCKKGVLKFDSILLPSVGRFT